MLLGRCPKPRRFSLLSTHSTLTAYAIACRRYARQNGRPGKVGHNVALRHSADKPVETVYKDCFPNVNSDLIVQIDNSHTIVERLCFFLIK
jgi:hypothetical protein